MAIARVQLSDGRIARFEVPEGTTPEQVQEFAKQQIAAAEQPAQAPVPIPEPVLAPTASTQPLTAQEATAQTLGLDPNIVERGAILPFGRTAEGETEFAVPQIALDVAGAALLPGQVLQGVEPTEEDILNAALTISPAGVRGGRLSSRPAVDATQTATQQAQAVSRAQPAATAQGVVTPQTATQLERAARFEQQNIPATTGDITQGFAQQADEARLISMASGEAGEPLRQAKLVQSEAFVKATNDLVDSLGVPSRTGDTIKAALTGRKTVLREEKNALYKQVADTAPEVANIPILTDTIQDAVLSPSELRRIRRLSPNTVDAVDELLVEFGINKSDEAVEAFLASGADITPLNLGNFEEFRQAINLIERSDQTGATKVFTGPIKSALDEEAALIDDAVTGAGITDESILGTLKEARSRVVTLKTEFSPESITGRLINVKRDGVTPVIEASKVTQELLRPTAPIENLKNTLKSLNAAPNGNRAVQDLRASVIMDALETALKAPSRKTGGVETIGGNQFANALSKFGDDKLALLFKGNEKALNSLQNLKQTALDITPTAGAVPRGSAPVILDIVQRAGKLPGLAAIRDAVNFVVNAGADDRAVARALDSKPKIKETLVGIRRDFPTIAERLGLITILDEQETAGAQPEGLS